MKPIIGQVEDSESDERFNDRNSPDRDEAARGEGGELLDEGSQQRRVRRLTWLLLFLLAAVGLLAGSTLSFLPEEPGVGSFRHPGTMPEAPPVVEASGRLAEVYEEALPATLRIESRCANPLFGDTPIDVGTGFFVSPDGKVVTAYHVVRRQSLPTRIRCILYHVGIDADQREYRLELTGFDAFLDLAVLEASVAEPVPYLELGGELPRVGAEILAIGNSRGEFLADRSGTVTRLGVSADRPDFAPDAIELTAALAPGDSGGPIIGTDGRVLGVVSYISFAPSILSSEGESPFAAWFGAGSMPEFASYAVPTLAGSHAVRELLAGVQRDVPVIGFELAFEYDPRDAADPALGSRPGVVVGRVELDGPGAQAGLRSLQERTVRDAEGRQVAVRLTADVIVAVDGVPTPTFERLLELVRERSVGDEVTITVQRGSDTSELELRLGAYRQTFR